MSSVLFLTRELPYPPNAGDRIVTYGFINALARRGHEVHVLGYERPDDDAAADALESVCASVGRVPPSKSPLPPPLRKAVRAAMGQSDVMAMFDSGALAEAAAVHVRTLEPDVVVAQHPYVGQVFQADAVERALAATAAEPVTSAHVVEYAAHRRQRRHAADLRSRVALAAEVPRLRREELAVYERSRRTLVLGREDREELAGRVSGPVRRQRVGLDVERYETAASPPEQEQEERVALPDGARGRDVADGGGSRDDRVLFFGSYDWFPNADAVRHLCEDVFPEIRAAHPAVELVLAGRGADEEIAGYGDRGGVTFHGEVDDLASLVRSAAAVVAPLRVGGGTRIKVLETMAWGVPVVTTPAGAEGIEATPGEDLHVADSTEAFAAQTARLLADPAERARMGANARETIERRYSIDAIGGELERYLGLA